MTANYTTHSSSSLPDDDQLNFFDDTNLFWGLDEAFSLSSLFGTSSTSSAATNNNYNFTVLNAPRIVSIPLPVVEDFIPLQHTADALLPYLPTPPPTPPSLTIYLLSSPRPSLHNRPQQSRVPSEGNSGNGNDRAGKKSKYASSSSPRSRRTPSKPVDPNQLLRTVRKRRLARRLSRIHDIESYLDNLELFDTGDVPLTSPD